MKRLVIWIAATVTIVVLLFGYHNSTNKATTTGSGIPSMLPPTGSSRGSSGASPPNRRSVNPSPGGSSASSRPSVPPSLPASLRAESDDQDEPGDDDGIGRRQAPGRLPGGSTGGSSGKSSSGPSSKPAGGSGVPHNSSVSGNYTGVVAQTMRGPVQVEITVKNGRVSAVNLVQYPNGNPRDAQINSYAFPILVQETISAQSTKIQMVSGATVTSGGYVQSLQSALDRAGI